MTDEKWIPLPKEDKKNESFFEKNVGFIIFFGLFAFIALYVFLGAQSDEPSPDCTYTNDGCQGETTKFGQ